MFRDDLLPTLSMERNSYAVDISTPVLSGHPEAYQPGKKKERQKMMVY